MMGCGSESASMPNGCPLSSLAPFTNTVGGGVASRTLPPTLSGTCKYSRVGLVVWARLSTVESGKLKFVALASELSTTDVAGMLGSLRLIVGPALALGFAGKVENG